MFTIQSSNARYSDIRAGYGGQLAGRAMPSTGEDAKLRAEATLDKRRILNGEITGSEQ